MPLSRHSVGTDTETISYATCRGTFCHSRLSSLSHCGLILAWREELVRELISTSKKKKKKKAEANIPQHARKRGKSRHHHHHHHHTALGQKQSILILQVHTSQWFNPCSYPDCVATRNKRDHIKVATELPRSEGCLHARAKCMKSV